MRDQKGHLDWRHGHGAYQCGTLELKATVDGPLKERILKLEVEYSGDHGTPPVRLLRGKPQEHWGSEEAVKHFNFLWAT